MKQTISSCRPKKTRQKINPESRLSSSSSALSNAVLLPLAARGALQLGALPQHVGRRCTKERPCRSGNTHCGMTWMNCLHLKLWQSSLSGALTHDNVIALLPDRWKNQPGVQQHPPLPGSHPTCRYVHLTHYLSHSQHSNFKLPWQHVLLRDMCTHSCIIMRKKKRKNTSQNN